MLSQADELLCVVALFNIMQLVQPVSVATKMSLLCRLPVTRLRVTEEADNETEFHLN